MELVVEPDLYAPSIDETGKYVDKIPSFAIHKKGIMCPCGARKDKVYETYTTFSSHIKTKNHQKWLENVNLNRTNYYVENEQLKETLQNQRIIIAKMEKEIQTKTMTIDYLTLQIVDKNKVVTNLLEFD
jgi:hypothetical protein